LGVSEIFIHLQAQIKYSFLKGCLIFIEKGGEIRLTETLATNPENIGERCQNLIPVKREMIKISTGNEKYS